MNILTNDIIIKELIAKIKFRSIFERAKMIVLYLFIIFIAVLLIDFFSDKKVKNAFLENFNLTVIIISSFCIFCEIYRKEDFIYVKEGYWRCVVGKVHMIEPENLFFEFEDMIVQMENYTMKLYNNLVQGDRVLLVVTESDSHILRQSEIEILRCYTMDEYYKYVDDGKKKFSDYLPIKKVLLHDVDLFIEIIYHEFKNITVIIVFLAVIVVLVLASVWSIFNGDTMNIGNVLIACIGLATTIKFIYKNNRREKDFLDNKYKKRYLLIECDNGVYGLIKNEKRDIKLIKEFSKSRYEYVGKRYKVDSSVFR